MTHSSPIKRVCAWCGTCIGFKCPHCARPLEKASIDKVFVLACRSGPSQIYYVNPHTFEESHTICNACLKANGRPPVAGGEDTLTIEDRANLAAYLIRRIDSVDKAIEDLEKRGPTEGIASANTPKPEGPK